MIIEINDIMHNTREKFTTEVTLPLHLYTIRFMKLKTVRIAWINTTIVKSILLLHFPMNIHINIHTKFEPKCKNLRAINKLKIIAMKILSWRIIEDEKSALWRALPRLHLLYSLFLFTPFKIIYTFNARCNIKKR